MSHLCSRKGVYNHQRGLFKQYINDLCFFVSSLMLTSLLKEGFPYFKPSRQVNISLNHLRVGSSLILSKADLDPGLDCTLDCLISSLELADNTTPCSKTKLINREPFRFPSEAQVLENGINCRRWPLLMSEN